MAQGGVPNRELRAPLPALDSASKRSRAADDAKLELLILSKDRACQLDGLWPSDRFLSVSPTKHTSSSKARTFI